MSNPKPHLPVMWQGADGAVRTNAVIDTPSAHDIEAFGSTVVNVCGGCKNFQPQHLSGNKKVLNNFLTTTLIEAEWRDKKFIGQPVEKLGRCGLNAELATGPMSKACEQYSPHNGRIR